MKRIISFDGGGVRGIFSLQIAKRIEQIFREEHGRADLVLADVVDLFAGTSTGAIIAACLAWGYPVNEVEKLYLENSRRMFSHRHLLGRLKSRYRAEVIADFFKSRFQEDDRSPALLSSKKLKKMLIIVMRNATTGSPWPISNNPAALYSRDPNDPQCNLKMPLWQLLRASTAAPLFFPPEEITLGSQKFLFVDGGVTPYNNPSLIATLMATLPCYHVNWPTGREALHLTSIGTGSFRSRYASAFSNKVYLWHHGSVVPGLIGAVGANQDMLCRVMGDCLHGSPIDSEIGCLDAPTLLTAAEQKFSYVRYNHAMDSRELGDPLSTRELRLDNLLAMPRVQEVGRVYAEKYVKRKHLYARKGDV